MTPTDIARFLPILQNEAHETAEAVGIEQPDMDRALADMVATLLADHIGDNLAYYENIRPVEADYVADLASR